MLCAEHCLQVLYIILGISLVLFAVLRRSADIMLTEISLFPQFWKLVAATGIEIGTFRY